MKNAVVIIVVTFLSFSQACHGAQLSTPIPTISIDGKKCRLVYGGVQCQGEGLKCVAPCRSKSTSKDDRPDCGSALGC